MTVAPSGDRSPDQLAEALAVLDTIIGASPIGYAVFDRHQRFVRVNAALAAMNGVPPEAHLGRTVAAVVPDVADAATALIEQVFRTGEPIHDLELSGMTDAAPGMVRTWIETLLPVPGPDGTVAAVAAMAREVTDERLLQHHLEEQHTRLRGLADSGLIGIVVGEDDEIVEANSYFARLAGFASPAELVAGASWSALTPPEDRPTDVAVIEQLLDGESIAPYEKRVVRPDGSTVPVLIGPIVLGTDPLRWMAFVIDLTARRALEAELEEIRRREHEARLHQTIEAVHDAVIIAAPVLDAAGAVVDLAIQYANPTAQAEIDLPSDTVVGVRLTAVIPELAGSQLLASLREVLTTGEPLVVTAQRFDVPGRGSRHLDLRARVVGTEVMVSWRDVTDDVRHATDLAARDHELRTVRAELRRERGVVGVLQQALVAPLPRLEHVELAARSLQASEGVLVGGDWYDAMVLPDGSVMLAIGDVAGHGISAARVSVEARTAMRALVVEGHDPAAVLEVLDRVFVAGGADHFATAVAARLHPDGRFEWAVAGHPPPLLAAPGADPEVLHTPPGPPLGTGFGGYTAAATHLAEGGTVLLYTDGLIERRDESIDVGVERLRRLLSPVPGAAEACERALAGALAPRRTDDVCLLAAHRL
ncbi:MAG TPA: SpoIIE family protein phosphatase [Acidimicrobiales bacterium]|nr:SpoIIE family protein phosphatase [Acidimicrobiales bacterium]